VPDVGPGGGAPDGTTFPVVDHSVGPQVTHYVVDVLHEATVVRPGQPLLAWIMRGRIARGGYQFFPLRSGIRSRFGTPTD